MKVRAKSDQYNRMAKEQEETLAKLSALDTEHQKSLKTILGLQTYITELPPKEEVGAKSIDNAQLMAQGEATEVRD